MFILIGGNQIQELLDKALHNILNSFRLTEI